MSDPRESEAKGSDASFQFRGETFTVPLERGEWSTDFLEALEDGRSVGIIRGALGPEQWETARPLVPKVKDLDALADKIAEAMGFGSTGESQPSSD